MSGYVRDMGVALEPPTTGHPLLCEPNLFAAPPPGFVAEGEVLAGEGVVLSARNYGRLWRGERRDRLPSRAEIRSAMEWGANLIDYLVRRRRGRER